ARDGALAATLNRVGPRRGQTGRSRVPDRNGLRLGRRVLAEIFHRKGARHHRGTTSALAVLIGDRTDPAGVRSVAALSLQLDQVDRHRRRAERQSRDGILAATLNRLGAWRGQTRRDRVVDLNGLGLDRRVLAQVFGREGARYNNRATASLAVLVSD